MEFDDVLSEHVGEFGRYQKGVCLLLTLVGVSNAFYVMDIVFMTAMPEHWCKTPLTLNKGGMAEAAVLSNMSAAHANLTSEEVFWLTVPMEDQDGQLVPSSCQIYDDADENLRNALTTNLSTLHKVRTSTNGSSSFCSQWDYGESQFSNGIVKQWDMVCQRRWLIATVSSAFLAGTLVGVMSGGLLSDRFGRRPVLAWFAFLAVIFRVSMAFSSNVYVFIALRFCIGLTNLDTYTSAYVLSTELVGPQWRVMVGNGMCVVWALGYMAVAGIAFCLRHTSWQVLTLTLTGCCLYVLLYFCAVPESPRWLLARGRKAEATAVLRRMAKVNGRALPDHVHLLVPQAGKKHMANPLILLRTAALRWRAIIILYTWFCLACVYYGLSLNVGDLAGDLYLNTFIMGAVEIPAYFLSQVLMGRRPGRRGTMASFLVWAGLVLLATTLVPTHLKKVKTALSVLGKLAISGGFATAYVFTTELFPTGLRQISLGTSSTVGRIGGIVAPYVGQLDKYSPLLPVCLLGSLALTAGIFTLFLPETRGCPLPLTIEEVENMHSTCGFGLGSFQPEDDSSDDVVVNNELMKGAPVCV